MIFSRSIYFGKWFKNKFKFLKVFPESPQNISLVLAYLGSDTMCHQFSRGLGDPKYSNKMSWGLEPCRSRFFKSIKEKVLIPLKNLKQLRLKYIFEFDGKFENYFEVNSVRGWVKQSEAGGLLLKHHFLGIFGRDFVSVHILTPL
jgi:hypothetical protein